MRSEIRKRLLALNREFYMQFADSFAATRQAPQPGFEGLLDLLPKPCREVVDVGCGNGRFGQFLAGHVSGLAYTGIDFTDRLLVLAAEKIDGTFLHRDISEPDFLAGLDEFDLVVCLATMQHVPGLASRTKLLQEMRAHLNADGRIFLSNWQFAYSDRQRRKILDWDRVGLAAKDLEPNDFLLSWQRDGRGMRYVHLVDEEEIVWLASEAGLNVVTQYRSDGKEGNLNLYSVLSPQG